MPEEHTLTEPKVLGYTLIRREVESGRDEYLSHDGIRARCWVSDPNDSGIVRDTLPRFLTWMAQHCGFSSRVETTYHIGRVVLFPNKQKIEQIQDPTEADAWGCRIHLPGDGPWRGPNESTSRHPIPMTFDEARDVREVVPSTRYLVPLRITHSEPRTIIDEVKLCG